MGSEGGGDIQAITAPREDILESVGRLESEAWM